MDYAVKVSVRNGRILQRMKERGIDSQAELARRAGIPLANVNEIVTFRKLPTKRGGQWREAVSRIAGVLNCDPEDLFSDAQRTLALPQNGCEVYMAERDVAALSYDGGFESSVWAKIEAEKIIKLAGSPRNQALMRARLEGATYAEAGADFGTTPERVRQIECKMIRMAKHPARKLGH
jgi:transcriptional regulator with XRE-family HTH domain